MTTHADAAHSTHDVAAHDHAAAVPVAVLDGLRFEKSELAEFSAADRSAGEHVGILLAIIFCISLVLFVGVTTWMMYNQSEGHDPHAIAGASDEHH